MRIVKLICAAVAALFISGAAHAQVWEEYVNRGDFFAVNFPGEPTRTDIVYKTAKGTSLQGHVYTAQDSRGRYSITVVDYNSAADELANAIDEAAVAMRAKGKPTYDAVNMLDMHRSWRMTVETPAKRRILAEILVSGDKRLYISDADTALNVPPPAQFSVSLQILDKDGLRIRYRQVTPASADEVVPVTPQATAQEVAKISTQVAGNWKSGAGGSCDAAFLKVGARVKTKRGEEAMAGTVTNAGTVIDGQLIISGPREGQLIDPKTDKVVMIFEPQAGNKMSLSALGPPAIGWPDVTLDLCPGSRA
jgi:uncharacterized glyoxalase superfamily protein PhnB